MPLCAQYYLTGEVIGSHGDNLQHVSVFVQSTGLVYKTGSYGNFEIVSRTTDDSLTFSAEGYEPYSTAVTSTEFLRVRLKERPLSIFSKKSFHPTKN